LERNHKDSLALLCYMLAIYSSFLSLLLYPQNYLNCLWKNWLFFCPIWNIRFVLDVLDF